MKLIPMFIALAFTLSAFAHNHDETKKKYGHDKEHSHVDPAKKDHDHEDAHHEKHDHKAHHPTHDEDTKKLKK